MNLSEAEKLANDLISVHCPKFKFIWLESVRVFGICKWSRSEIGLSKHLTELNSEEQVRDTILHEIAHAISPKFEGHGKIWKSNCVKIGAKPIRCYGNDVLIPKGKYIKICNNCGKESVAYRKRKKIACGNCCRKYNGGEYSEKFILKYKRVK